MMGKLLHTAVIETTKLFEKTVQEMIAELARIRKQNHLLKDNLFTDDTPSPSSRVGYSKRDVGVQCDAPTTAIQVERSCSPLDPAALPPNALQNTKEEFALVFVKKEESDTYDETQACIFAKISEDQPRQILVQQRGADGEASLASGLVSRQLLVQQRGADGEASLASGLVSRQILVQQRGGGGEESLASSLVSRQLLVQQRGTGEASLASSLVSRQILVQQRGAGEASLVTSSLIPVKLAAFQPTNDRPGPTVALTRLTSSELTAAQKGTLTLSQPKVTVALTTTQQQQGTTTSPLKGTVSWTQHQGTLTLTRPTDALAAAASSSPSPLPQAPASASVAGEVAPAPLEPLLVPKTEPEECDMDAEDAESTDSLLSVSDPLRRTSSRQTPSRYRRSAMESKTPPPPPPARAASPEHLSPVHRKSPDDLVSVAAETAPETEEEPLQRNQCEVCSRVLSSATALECHRRIHSGERPWVCERCGKGFPDGRGLRRHLHIHNPKTHQCKDCGKTFVYTFQLRNHQVIHTSEMAFECKVCGKGFKSKSTGATHMFLHTGEKPFQCSVCFKRFRHRMSYNTHMQRHRGEKRYACLTCKKRFSDPNNLKAHKRIHTGERPYECTSCDKKFKQSAHLKKHVATQH